MISVRMADAINGQINAELYSAYLYLSMRSYFDATKLPGCANWMRVQAMEEFTHADRLYRYLNESGVRARPSGTRPWRCSRPSRPTSRRSPD